MTSPNQPSKMSVDEMDVDNVMDMLRSKSRELSIGAAVVIVIGGGFFLWRQSALTKEANAEKALNEAELALQSGNRPLGEADLTKVADRYRDTAAGVEAALVSAQVDFEDQRWDDGLKVLQAIQKSSAIGQFAGPVEGLIGGALADEKKYDDAANHYKQAAALAEYQSVKDFYYADAARVLAIGGKRDEARKIWEDIASRPDSPSIGEAKVRLGELNVGPAKN